jgi:X-X-X-Leu-X-X-Gly heptad repeat protein
MNRFSNARGFYALCLVAVSAWAPVVSNAADNSASPNIATLEEIVVTAQRREENVLASGSPQVTNGVATYVDGVFADASFRRE